MLATILRTVIAALQSVALFFLAPIFYVTYAILKLAERRSKTASNIILKAQLVRDVIVQSPPPSYQSATETDQTAIRLRALDISLRSREVQLATQIAELNLDQQEIENRKRSLANRDVDVKNREKLLDARESTTARAETELASRRESLEEEIRSLRQEQTEVQRLHDKVKHDRAIVEQQRSENTLALQKLHEERRKAEDHLATQQKRLEEQRNDINELHDRFLRSQLESLDHHRSEHKILIESLQSRLTESQQMFETEQERSQNQNRKSEQLQTELEQRCAFLTNELAERTDREFNLVTELGELRRKLSDERGNFNKEFGELSRALSDLKLRCSQYENQMISEDHKRQDLNTKEKTLADFEQLLSTREELLNTQTQMLQQSEKSLKAKLDELTSKEITLEGKAHTLQSLQATLEGYVQNPSDHDLHQHGDEILVTQAPPAETGIPIPIPDTSSQDKQSPIDTSNPLSPTRPTIRERVSRRTSEFVERVNSAAHRRSASYSNSRHSHEIPARTTKSRDGLKTDAT